MKKLAIFVEGQTEQIFVEALCSEVIGTKHLKLEVYGASGGGQAGPRTIQLLRAFGNTPEAQYFVMIVDCGCDNRVRSDIADRYDGLVAAGYAAVIGIRDVYPDVSFNDIPKLRAGLQMGLKAKSYPSAILFGCHGG